MIEKKFWRRFKTDIETVLLTSPTEVARRLTIFSCGTATTLWPLISMIRCPTRTPPRSAIPPRNRLHICNIKPSNDTPFQWSWGLDVSPGFPGEPLFLVKKEIVFGMEVGTRREQITSWCRNLFNYEVGQRRSNKEMAMLKLVGTHGVF